ILIKSKYQIEFVENILKYIPPEKGSQFTRLADWLKKHYGIARTNSGRNKLSHDGKVALRQWIGAINFKDFENLVDAIITVILLENKERDQIKKQQNQIKRRQYFWSNYTYQFERIRILLPMKTSNILKATNYNLEGIDLLREDGSDNSEVCIFEFSPYIIVEFFRGVGSETIIFDHGKNYFYKNRKIDLVRTLFESQLSIKQIRSIDVLSENIHDHA
ncbi:MAG: EH signature domain-containing protein, partial [Synechocystis sp.]